MYNTVLKKKQCTKISMLQKKKAKILKERKKNKN